MLSINYTIVNGVVSCGFHFLYIFFYHLLFIAHFLSRIWIAFKCEWIKSNQIKSTHIHRTMKTLLNDNNFPCFFFLSKSGLLSRFLRWFVWFSSTIAPETHRSIVNRVHEKRWRFKIELFQVCLNKNVFTFVFYLYEIICSQHCQILRKK